METTTGPLGQGVGNAVGMAMAARRERGLLDPNAAEGGSPFDHHIYAMCSDGDLEEGVSGEASSIAGTQRLGNLTLIYDANNISIEDNTDVAFNEDVAQALRGLRLARADRRLDPGRHEVQGGRACAVRRHPEGGGGHGQAELHRAAHGDRLAGSERPEHRQGARLGTGRRRGRGHQDGSSASTPTRPSRWPDDVIAHTRTAVDRGKEAQAAWQSEFEAWARKPSADLGLFERLQTRTLPTGWDKALPSFPADPKGMATRKASGAVINGIADALPELWGGSADLAESNNTTIENAPSFIPKDRSTKMWRGDPYAGRVLHFGIREHAMGAILNGIAVHGGTRVFGGTFLTFSDYMRASVRLAAIMQLPVIYVWTHDSIGLGEDGPTHQPIEHLAALRAIPGLDVVRPADANETAAVWQAILENPTAPAGIALTRQNVPVFPRGEDGFSDTSNVHRGGYVLLDVDGGLPDVVLIGTGSEVQLAVAARDLLAEEGIRARVVSMPCREWFDRQDASYRETVIPPTVKARVSVEAGVAQGWREVVGDAGRIVSVDHYGASADFDRIYREFGLTGEAVAAAAQDSIRVATG